MNKKIILWTAAAIIAFLTIFVHQRLSPYYSVSGSMSAGEEKVTYNFPRIHYGHDSLIIMIRKDMPDFSGQLFLRLAGSEKWEVVPMYESEKFLAASLKIPVKLQNIEYYAEVIYKNRMYRLPPDYNVVLTTAGKRPKSVMYNLYFFLFGGLLLAVRGALEYFNPADKRKLFALVTTIFFFISGIIFYPFIRSYELDVINKSVPAFSSLFDMPLVTLFFIWLAITVVLFRWDKKILLAAGGILTIIIYQFSNFY